MTVRSAELLMAILLGILSASLMWKSAELPIGWRATLATGGFRGCERLCAQLLRCAVPLPIDGSVSGLRNHGAHPSIR